MNNIILTDNELEIMELMWEMKRPLSRSEIIELSPNKSWKASSIHILLNKMIAKEAITVDGFVRTGKNYGRTFSPLFSQEEYMVSSLKEHPAFKGKKKLPITALFSALIKDEYIDDETIKELERIINERKEQTNK